MRNGYGIVTGVDRQRETEYEVVWAGSHKTPVLNRPLAQTRRGWQDNPSLGYDTEEVKPAAKPKPKAPSLKRQVVLSAARWKRR